ncbi:MAG: Ig-like domain repeat protein, partial [Isosphaeraceae bacterium]
DFAVETGLYFGGGEGFSPTYDSTGLNLVVIPEMAGTTTTVASQLNPSSYGQSVTFTATVASTLSTGLTPTGTITFYDGASTLGTASLSGGTASFTTSALVAGSHSIIAQYAGDSNFSGSNSTPLTQIVNQDGSGTVVTSSLNPSTYGQSVILTASVSATSPGGGTPTGTVTFYDGSTSLGSATLSNGTATLTTSALGARSHSITASYGGDTDFTGSTSTAITQTVNQDGSTTAISSATVNPSVFGQSVTFTASVSAAAPGSGTPMGIVTFYDGPTILGTAALSGGSASYTTSSLAVGTHSITAGYGGDGNFTGSNSTAFAQAVNQDGSATVVTSSLNPSIIDQPVTFTATVTAASPGSGMPTGTVTFYDGSTAIDTETLSNGSATFTTATLAVGNHAISVQYGGDTDFAASTSAAITQTVTQASSTAVVSSSVNPTVFGQSVTFTATVSASPPGSGTPTGTVTFYDGSTAINTETLGNGSASYVTSALTTGSHAITVQYGGDSVFNGSTSAAVTQVVNQDSTGAALTSSLNPSIIDQPVTFTATVSATSPGSGMPSGTITFYDGSTAIDTETLSNGSAAFTTSSLSLGDHSISASYGGDSNFTGNTSTTLTQTVQNPPTATLNGEVYNDVNGGGILETGDAGLSDWTVQLLNGSNNVIATTTTDSSGDYSFTGVIAGSYTVAPVAPGEYVPTGPTSGTLAVTAAAGQTINNLNFGEFQTVTVSGEVFDDVSNSGSFNTNDPGLSGWTVDLSNASNQVIGTATDSNGDYSFSGLGPGTYSIAEVLQPGYIATAPATGSLTFAPASGAQITGENLGVFKAVSLAVTGLTTTPSSDLQSGTSLVVQWSDTNTGTLPAAGSFTDSVTVTNTSTGQVLATGLVPYDATTSGNLGAGAAAPQQYAFRIPDGYPGVGQIQFTVTTDVNDNVSTAQGDPGKTATHTETSTLAPYPALVVSAVSDPVDAWSGRGIVVSWTVANQGTAATQGTWYDTVELDQAGSSAPGLLLGQFASPENLSPGQSYQRTQDFTLPQGISGNYQIVVTTDVGSSFYDINPANNTASSAVFPVQLTPSPDLQVTAITVPPTATDGQQATFSWTVTNNGTGATNSPTWTDAVYLSRDQTLSADDIFIGTAENPSALAPGESYTQSLTANIPGNPTGPFFVIVAADSNDGQAEYPFNNDNVTASSAVVEVQALPAPGFLHVSQVSVSPSPPSTIHGGDFLTVNWTVQNTGGSPVTAGSLSASPDGDAWIDGVFLSQTPTVSASQGGALDIMEDFADAASQPVLNIGDSYSETDTVQLPQFVYGSWYLVVVPNVDQTAIGAVNQTADENSVALPITAIPAPALQVNSVTTPASGVGGQSIPVTWTVSNQGFASTAQGELPQPSNGSEPSSAVQWTDAVYLSTSTTLQLGNPTTTTLLGTFEHVGDLSPLQSYTETQQITLPSNVQGPFYIFVETDSGNILFEGPTPPSNTGYDATPIQITLPPPADLQVTSIEVPSTAGSGLPISIGWTVTNTGPGTTATTGWDDQIVLSTDDSLTTTDDNVILGVFPHNGSLAPTGQYTTAGTVTLPVGISGTYYLFVTADSNNVAAGLTGEVNNSTSIALPITSTPPPKLQITTFQTTGPILSGQALPIDWTVTNTGSGPTRASETSWTDRIYLSTNGTLDTNSDPLLGGFIHNGGLSPGASYTESQAVTLPVGISGNYTLFVVVDALNQVYQSSAGSIDSQALPINVTLTPPPDLEVSSVSAPMTAYTSQFLTVNWTVTNEGTGPASPQNWSDTVYLSTDQFITGAITLGTVDHSGGLAAGASYSASLAAQIPDYASGPYYVFVQADSGNLVFEGGATGSHEAFDPTAVVVTMPLPSDLTVSTITVPPAGIAGQPPLTPITWTVTNLGVNPHSGPGTTISTCPPTVHGVPMIP